MFLRFLLLQVRTLIFEVGLQDRAPAALGTSVALETVHLTIQAGTVTLVPALTDANPIAVPPDEIHYNAPTPVSRERFIEVYDFPM